MTDPSDILLRHLFWSFLLQSQLSQTDKKQKVKITVAPVTTLLIHRKNKKEKKKDKQTSKNNWRWKNWKPQNCLAFPLSLPGLGSALSVCFLSDLQHRAHACCSSMCSGCLFFPPSVATFLCFHFVFKRGELFVDLVWIFFFFSLPPFWGGVSQYVVQADLQLLILLPQI